MQTIVVGHLQYIDPHLYLIFDFSKIAVFSKYDDKLIPRVFPSFRSRRLKPKYRRPGVWGPPRSPAGARGSGPVGGPGGKAPPVENGFQQC